MTTKIRSFKGIRKLLVTFSVILFLPFFVFADEGTKKDEGKKFDAGDMIIEHVSDAHSWHIAGHYSIPLPIILYSKDRGLMIFSSAKLKNEAIFKGLEKDTTSHNGFKESGIHIIVANPDGTINKAETDKIWDLSLTKNALTVVLTGILLVLTFTAASRGYKKRPNGAPKGVQSFMEPIIMFVRDDIAIPSIGKDKYEKYMPYLLTLFFFVVFLNILGLVPIFPGGANVTGNIAITTTLACFTFIIMMINSGKTYWVHTLWMPGVPAVVKLCILTPIEILGVILKPFTLLIRIFANILAGHIVALSFFSLIFIFGALWGHSVGYGVSIFSVGFAGGMLLLDTLVALIQAYVFTLLSAIYFGMVTAEDSHH